MRSRLVILLFAFVSVYVLFNMEMQKKNQFQWDASGYYLYMPAIFIYHDLAHFSFYHEVNEKYMISYGEDTYGLYDTRVGRKNDKYAIGTAVLQLPFFLIAHAFCVATQVAPADGYSMPYQLAGYAGNIFWICMGLLFISVLLRRYFNENITAFTVLCIAFGTNIYCYTIFAPAMSHPYGFFLFAGVLYYTDAFYRKQKAKYMYLIGLLLGLVLIVRPVNIVVAIIPLLWEVYDKQSFITRMQLLGSKLKAISVTMLIIFLVALIQMAYWKYSSGQWIYYSYVGEGFKFTRPHIINGLFSYQKGWFVYTPIAFISMLGLFATWKANRKIVPALSIFFLLMFYIVFCWKGWWYGGSFSARALIEALPVTALPLAYMFQSIYSKGSMLILKISFSVLMSFFIALNLFQSYQYSMGVIHYVLMNKAYYWRSFGKIRVSEEDRKTMMTWDEYLQENIDTEASKKD
ncbi:MAG: hypothetical protein JWQ38_1454 [Flavipsychrobacter sp.]|nr:hypothetical protein [Flavipsychrobacter sp.]